MGDTEATSLIVSENEKVVTFETFTKQSMVLNLNIPLKEPYQLYLKVPIMM